MFDTSKLFFSCSFSVSNSSCVIFDILLNLLLSYKYINYLHLHLPLSKSISAFSSCIAPTNNGTNFDWSIP